MPDQVLTCRDCGETFTFTQGEQDFYRTKGLSAPSRCPDCRQQRKRQREREWSGGSTGGGYGVGGSYGERRTREKELYDVVCASCGKPTQVPFKPRGIRPVYCRDCFAAQRH